jgi:hypothetical protein
MVEDDVLYRPSCACPALAAALGNVREACRTMGGHLST